jgi:tetratricopeptide (TPR) repeat protein
MIASQFGAVASTYLQMKSSMSDARGLILGAMIALVLLLFWAPVNAGPVSGKATAPLPFPRTVQPGEAAQLDPLDVLIARAWSIQDLPAVIVTADQRLSDVPGDGFARMLRGAAHFNMDNYDSAIADQTRVLLDNKDAVMAFQIRGAAYYEKELYGKAIEDETQALKILPNAFSLSYRGAARVFSKDSSGAIADLTASLAMVPDDAWAHAVRGAAEIDMFKYRAALDDETTALYINAKDSYARKLRGYARFRLNDFKGAIADEGVALAAGPDGYAFSVRGSAKYSMRDYAGTVQDERSAIANNTRDAFTYANLGSALSMLKSYADAIDAFNLSLKLAPTNRIIQKRRDLARCLLRAASTAHNRESTFRCAY